LSDDTSLIPLEVGAGGREMREHRCKAPARAGSRVRAGQRACETVEDGAAGARPRGDVASRQVGGCKRRRRIGAAGGGAGGGNRVPTPEEVFAARRRGVRRTARKHHMEHVHEHGERPAQPVHQRVPGVSPVSFGLEIPGRWPWARNQSYPYWQGRARRRLTVPRAAVAARIEKAAVCRDQEWGRR